MKRISHLLFLSLIILLLNPISGFAQELTIFGADSKQPKYWKQNDKPRGILVDMIKYAEKEMGYSLPVELYPWKRAYKYALHNKGAIIGLSKTSERLKIFDYSEPIFYDDVILVVKKGKEFPFTKMDDLRGKIIAYQRGASYGNAFTDAEKAKIFKSFLSNTPLQSLHQLHAGRVDAAIFSPGETGLLMSLKKDEQLFKLRHEFVILPHLIARDSNHLGISKEMKMKPFILKFNQIIKKGYETGEFQKIIDQYINTND